MSVFVTALRMPNGYIDYVLMDGTQVIARLAPHSSVEDAYQHWMKKSKEEFDWRSAGYPNPDWPSREDWDHWLAEGRRMRHKRDLERAKKMVAVLEPYRNATFVEADWQKQERSQLERAQAEAVKSVYKVKTEGAHDDRPPKENPVKRAARAAALFRELDQLIGLASAKQKVKSMVNHLKVQQARKASRLKTVDLSHHLVFCGNPGTGKTTVARLLAAIYREIGVLSKGHLIETDRAGLVAEYLGQTAPKVKAVVTKALGGVLFIDEAYALTPDEQDEYGAEAISALLKMMEDYRDKLVVIVAGYPREMKRFLEANPGLQSRFNNYIIFDDYTADELTAIFRRFCSEADYDVSPEVENAIRDMFQAACAAKDSRFGNGRLARNCFEQAVNIQANRIASQDNPDLESLTKLIAQDIPKLEAVIPTLLSTSEISPT